MPELPEVEVIVQGLGKKIKGLTISKISVNFPKIIKHGDPRGIHKLQGQKFSDISRYGKFIIAGLSGGGRIMAHLGMTGKLLVLPTDEKIPKHSHLVIDFEENCRRLVYNDTRRFGKILYSLNGEGHIDRELSSLGIDPLMVSFAKFFKIIRSHGRMIKALLLDQTVIAGIGNIYADEALFAAGIHPRQLSNEIPDDKAANLHKSVRSILKKAIKAGGSTIDSYRHEDGSLGYFQLEHRIYGKAGQPCPECGEVIHKITVAGRSSSVCINCQEPPIVKPTARIFRECWWGQ